MCLDRWEPDPARSTKFVARRIFRNLGEFTMLRRSILWMLPAFLLAALVGGRSAVACPFCSAVSQTLSEEITAMDAVVIAQLEVPPPAAKPGEVSDEVPKAKFKIVEIVKGQSLLTRKPMIETVYFGDAKKGKKFLITGVGPENLQWSTPLSLTDRAQAYLLQLGKIAKAGSERLEFFQQYLEDQDDLLARDSYDEFAKSPYEAVQALKPKMNHSQLIAWIKDSNIPTSRRRLYFTMLGVCGTQDDIGTLEAYVKSNDRKEKAGLDALIACYLMLKGADGMPLVEDLYLKNRNAEYADTYAAIMALRFHGNDVHVIEKPRIVQAMRHMLDRPNLADLVIPDLAKWEDWSSMEKLVKLFKEADEKTSWVKVPVVNYLRVCPLPEAKQHIKELEKIDPESVRRAQTFFPVPSGAAPPAAPAKS